MEVLTESRDDSGFIQGLTKNGLPVLLSDGFLTPNTFVKVSLQKNTSCGFIGTVLEAIS